MICSEREVSSDVPHCRQISVSPKTGRADSMGNFSLKFLLHFQKNEKEIFQNNDFHSQLRSHYVFLLSGGTIHRA